MSWNICIFTYLYYLQFRYFLRKNFKLVFNLCIKSNICKLFYVLIAFSSYSYILCQVIFIFLTLFLFVVIKNRYFINDIFFSFAWIYVNLFWLDLPSLQCKYGDLQAFKKLYILHFFPKIFQKCHTLIYSVLCMYTSVRYNVVAIDIHL